MATDGAALLDRVRGVQGLSNPIIVSRAGVLQAGTPAGAGNGETVVAMAAILHASAESIGQEIRRGGFQHVLVHMEKSTLLVTTAGSDSLLVASVESDDADPVIAAVQRALTDGKKAA